MNSKVLTGVIIAIVVIFGAFVFLRSSGPQPTNNPAPSTNVTSGTPIATSEPSMSEMPMNSQSPSAQPSSSPAAQSNSGQASVQIVNFSFSPASLTVKMGQTVTWTNQDSIGHSATSDDGSFDTGVLAQGKSGSFTFTKAGTYAYHCSVHPNMHGTIIVQ